MATFQFGGRVLRGCNLVLLGAVVFSGCGKHDAAAPTLAALDGAEQYELLTLDPSWEQDVPPENFHGWRILGRTSITDGATRKQLNDALRTGARDSDGMIAKCFDPRHGLRTTRAGHTTDVVICFHCLQAQVFKDGEKLEGFLTTRSPEAAFDAVLRDAAVPLAEKGKFSN